LPTVHFGQHEVTRLVCGSNPFYGYSHFNRLFSRHMIEWMTPERVISVLKQCERNGIGSWQTGCRERNYSDLQRYRAEGGKMNVFFLAHGGMVRDVKQIRTAAKFGPVGIAYHGGVTDAKFRDGRMEEVHDFLKTVHDAGVLAGISCHNPAVIEYVEDKDWEVDYYQACFYRVTRTHEEIVRELGEAPVGELYLERDPERMTRVIRQTRRPCLNRQPGTGGCGLPVRLFPYQTHRRGYRRHVPALQRSGARQRGSGAADHARDQLTRPQRERTRPQLAARKPAPARMK